MVNKVTLLGLEFHFGIGFLNDLIDGTGIKLDEFQNHSDLTLIPKLMYYSSAYASKRNGNEISMTIYDIYDMIDKNGGVLGSFCTEFKNAFVASMNQDVPVDTSKKKAISPKK